MINIRPATVEDLKFIVGIYNEAILTTTATFDLEAKTEKQQLGWFESHGSRNPILVAEQNNEVVGWVSLNQYSDRKAYASTVESSLYIKKDYQGIGIGKKLLQAIIHEGKQIGLHTILAKITTNNEISIKLHQSQGFENVGVMKEVGRKFGELLDVLIMQKMLKASDFKSLDIEFNLFEYSLCFGRTQKGQIYNQNDIKWAYTGTDNINRIFGANFSVKEAEKMVSQLVDKFNGWNATVDWIVGPSSKPMNLSDILEEKGFKLIMDYWAGMDFQVKGNKSLVRKENFHKKIEVRQVTDETSLTAWVNTMVKGFEKPESALEDFQQIFHDLGVGSSRPWKYFLGLYEGEPVATGSLFKGRTCWGIYWISTVPKARGKGIATHIVEHILKEAAEEGVKKVVLQASPAGYKVYKKIGFVEQCRMKIYSI